MIRYHSFYPWHGKQDYEHLASEHDRQMLRQLHLFNQFDLYSKVDKLPNIDELKPYYERLVNNYLPGVIRF